MSGYSVGTEREERKRFLLKPFPFFYLFLVQELLESVSQNTPWSFSWESQTWKWLASIIVPLWNPNSGRKQREVWRPLTGEPDGLNPSLEQSQKAVRVPGQCWSWSGQCIPDGLPSFLGFGTSWSSWAVSQRRPLESSGQLSSGRNQAQDDCGGLKISGRAPSFVWSIWISFFRLLKTLTLLC